MKAWIEEDNINYEYIIRYLRDTIPQGEGQTFTISAQTNAKYYQAYSISFLDPWFGGKRPNSFSVNAFFSLSTGLNNNFYNTAMMNNYYNSLYGYGYGNYNNYYNNY